jgi:hypothetical protein
LSKDRRILDLFKRVYALEKLHGTSSHLTFKEGKVVYFSGGENHQTFVKCFDEEVLLAKMKEIFHEPPSEVTVYGEAYGGKMQKMSATYGTKARFIAFDVMISGKWLQAEQAKRLVENLGLEFVPFNLVDCTREALDAERDIPSRVGVANALKDGVVDYVPRPAEGIVIRPVVELVYPGGDRIIAKHKRDDFSERASKKDTQLDPAVAAALTSAEAVAAEFVTEERGRHVADKLKGTLGRTLTMSDTPAFLDAMVEDVVREGAGEFEDAPVTRKAIRSAAGKLFRKMDSEA